MAKLTHWANPTALTRALQYLPKGWLDGADETKELPLGCELGAPVLVGIVLGWMAPPRERNIGGEGKSVELTGRPITKKKTRALPYSWGSYLVG